MSDVTQMLQAVGRGEARAAEDLLPLVYDQLRHLAAVRIAQESAGQTLQATALVHEAWLRLVKEGERNWQNRAFFSRRPPKPCDESLSKTPGASPGSKEEEAVLKESPSPMPTRLKAPLTIAY